MVRFGEFKNFGNVTIFIFQFEIVPLNDFVVPFQSLLEIFFLLEEGCLQILHHGTEFLPLLQEIGLSLAAHIQDFLELGPINLLASIHNTLKLQKFIAHFTNLLGDLHPDNLEVRLLEEETTLLENLHCFANVAMDFRDLAVEDFSDLVLL